ncbi:MAG: DUF1592 domain-containing protein [Myxococcales bacterium]|nr:DUF1592 domain-containing protein [Myxococcales bacterium]
MDLTKTTLGVALLLASACYEGPGAGPSDPEADPEAEGTSEGGETDDDALDAACEGSTLALPPLRRLTPQEYRNTVLDLLGIDAAELVATFPEDPRIDGFDNNAAAQAMGLAHVTRYQAAAEWIAAQALDDPELAFGCDPSAVACRDAFIDERVPLLWRRPLTDGERERLRALAEAAPDGDPRTGLGLVLRAVLQSPHLLLRPEPGAAEGSPTGFELATRLSYFLWRSAPDADLHQRAAAGELEDPDAVAELVRQMWADPRAARGRAGLAEGWLRADRLAAVVRDPALYPEWTPTLQQALADELVALVERFATGEDDFLDVLTTAELPIDERTASLYGVPVPTTADPVSVPGPWRGGLLSTAAVLALTTPGNVTSPVARGLWVREVMLCEPLPPPPAGVEVEPLDGADGQGKQAQLEAHRSDPACAGCHDRIDPIGLGLERYDALGRLRTHDEWGEPASELGRVETEGLDDPEFAGALRLGERLQQAPATRTCVATHVLRWAHGRSETASDACALEAAGARLEQTGRLEDLAVAIATLGLGG